METKRNPHPPNPKSNLKRLGKILKLKVISNRTLEDEIRSNLDKVIILD